MICDHRECDKILIITKNAIKWPVINNKGEMSYYHV